MVAEAIERKLIAAKNVVAKLREKPEIVKQLSKYSERARKIKAMNIQIVPLTAQSVESSELVRKQYGLLTNDSILVAVMQELNLNKLATLDSDFDRIESLSVYKPSDV